MPDGFDSVDEHYTDDQLGQLVVSVEATPTVLCRLGEFEDHGERRLVGEASLGVDRRGTLTPTEVNIAGRSTRAIIPPASTCRRRKPVRRLRGQRVLDRTRRAFEPMIEEDVSGNCKSDIRGNPKSASLGLSIPGRPARCGGEVATAGTGHGFTDGRPGCC